MSAKITGIELLQQNFANVEAKYIAFFEKGQPRWPSEKRDYLRNHHQSFGRFLPEMISWERLQMNDLPVDILQEARAAFEAFKRDEVYPGSAV
ncbi:MAG TPA: hypothetical protein VMH27_10475 [Puia sp.]|nr:hypothetical protein [Puia sp.]